MRREADFAHRKRIATSENNTFAMNVIRLYPARSNRYHDVVEKINNFTLFPHLRHRRASATAKQKKTQDTD